MPETTTNAVSAHAPARRRSWRRWPRNPPASANSRLSRRSRHARRMRIITEIQTTSAKRERRATFRGVKGGPSTKVSNGTSSGLCACAGDGLDEGFRRGGDRGPVTLGQRVFRDQGRPDAEAGGAGLDPVGGVFEGETAGGGAAEVGHGGSEVF